MFLKFSLMRCFRSFKAFCQSTVFSSSFENHILSGFGLERADFVQNFPQSMQYVCKLLGPIIENGLVKCVFC